MRATGKGSPVRQPWLPPRAALGPGVLLALGGYGYAAITGFAVLHLDAAHVGGGGAVLAVFALFAVGVRLVAPDATDRLGGRRAALLALAAQSAGLAVLAPASALVPALLGAALAGLGTSLMFPSLALLVLERTEPARRASAIGGFSAFLDLGVALSGPATGALARAAGYDVAFGVAAMLGVAAVAGLLLWSRRRAGPGLTVAAATSSFQNRSQVGNLRRAGSGREAQMQDQPFILDAVAHAYHFGEDNYAHQAHASAITDLAYSLIAADATHWMPREAYCRDWSVEEMAWLLFTETDTDVAVFHPTPINAYKDGLISVREGGRGPPALAATGSWPTRPSTRSPGRRRSTSSSARSSCYDPIGLKLYPTSWRTGGYPEGWRMDDPEVAFPLYEKARSLGPEAPWPSTSPCRSAPCRWTRSSPATSTRRRATFPDLAFEIVHGGVAFTEETAWMLARFPNVYINMETLNIILALNPRRFAEIMATLLSVGGEAVDPAVPLGQRRDGAAPASSASTRSCAFQMPEDLLSAGGVFGEVPQLTDEHKRMMLGSNYATSTASTSPPSGPRSPTTSSRGAGASRGHDPRARGARRAPTSSATGPSIRNRRRRPSPPADLPAELLEAVRTALDEVIDPCSAAHGRPLSVWEMGLVRDLAVEDGVVTMQLYLTSPVARCSGSSTSRPRRPSSRCPASTAS